jgi:hypothetical protein
MGRPTSREDEAVGGHKRAISLATLQKHPQQADDPARQHQVYAAHTAQFTLRQKAYTPV